MAPISLGVAGVSRIWAAVLVLTGERSRLTALMEALSTTPQVPDRSTAATHAGRQTQRRLAPGEIDQLVREYGAGDAMITLATRWGLHRTTVADHVRASGVRLRRQGVPSDQVIVRHGAFTAGLCDAAPFLASRRRFAGEGYIWAACGANAISHGIERLCQPGVCHFLRIWGKGIFFARPVSIETKPRAQLSNLVVGGAGLVEESDGEVSFYVPLAPQIPFGRVEDVVQ